MKLIKSGLMLKKRLTTSSTVSALVVSQLPILYKLYVLKSPFIAY